jgi:curli production assembly/transport component CsgE
LAKHLNQNDSLTVKQKIDGLEIEGLIIDKTQSKIGKEFYELFFTQWTPPEVNFSYNILLEEKTSPGFGTQVSITINDLLIFQQLVQPRYDKIEEMVMLALQVASSHLQYYKEVQQEIESDDLKGTGIY